MSRFSLQWGSAVRRRLAFLVACSAALMVLGVFNGGTAVASPAEAFVGFQINSVDVDPLFLFDNQGTNSFADDTLTAGLAHVDLSLKFDGSEQVYSGASFDFDADLVGVTPGSLPGTTVYELLFDGAFSFKEAGTNDLILGATFSDARLLMLEFGDSGLIGFAGGLAADDQVSFAFGPAAPAGLSVTGDEQFQFTVANLQAQGGGPVHINSVPPPDNLQFENFTFNNSFSGSMLTIPEPAAIVLAAIGLLGLVACRRRWA